VIIGLSDAQSFFTGDNSPIPKDWIFLKSPVNARLISIVIIIFSNAYIWIGQIQANSKEIEELLQVTQSFSLPFLQESLNRHHKSCSEQFDLSENCRMYILQPIRRKRFNWLLHIVCHTGNMDKRELNLRLRLDEGSIGYALQSIGQHSKFKAQFISLVKDIPAGYKHFSQNNKDIISSNIKGYLIIPSFEGDFLNSLLVVDTTELNDLPSFQDKKFQEQMFDWIGNDPKFLSLLWRLMTDANRQ
jgi:hypothetical protein